MDGFGAIYELDGIPTLDESNWKQWVRPMSGGVSETGYIPPPVSAVGAFPRFPSELIIPQAQWSEMIRAKLAKKERNTDFVRDFMPKFWLNQSPTNSCWCFGPVQGAMILFGKQNQKPVRLSPYSISGPINGYRDVGGWGTKCIEFMQREGIASCVFWPMSTPGSSNTSSENRAAINSSRKYYEPSRADAATRKNLELFRCETWEEKASALLRGFVVPDGYNYEGHETCSIDLVEDGGTFGCTDMDSYTKDGTPHLRNRMGSRRAMGDDAIAMRLMSAA